MEISLTPDTYQPIVNNRGEYVDKIPAIKTGLYCVCGTRKEKVYENENKFGAHIKTKKHKKWLDMLNDNKANYYVELIKNKELLEEQRKIIGRLEVQLQQKELTIHYLTQQLVCVNSMNDKVGDLLDLN
jgi:hypothetical protein